MPAMQPALFDLTANLAKPAQAAQIRQPAIYESQGRGCRSALSGADLEFFQPLKRFGQNIKPTLPEVA